MIGYYYCSLSTFLNIIKNKSIYLSDPLKMNDNLEIKWYIDKLNDERNNSNDGFKASGSLYHEMTNRSCLDFTCEELMQILESKGQNSVYICCFSEESDMLSQWKGYADDGKGVSIGFNLEKLTKFDNLLFKKVIYTDSVVHDDIESGVECVADTINTVISEQNITKREEKIEVFLHELIPELVKYKNPTFAEEKEIRLIYCDDLKFEKIVNDYNAFTERLSLKSLEHDFRIIGNDNITEFVKLNFTPDIIEKICIGPKCLLNKSDVRNITKKLLGIEISTIESKCSYR